MDANKYVYFYIFRGQKSMCQQADKICLSGGSQLIISCINWARGADSSLAGMTVAVNGLRISFSRKILFIEFYDLLRVSILIALSPIHNYAMRNALKSIDVG